MLALIKMNIYQDFELLGCIFFGCSEKHVITDKLKNNYAIIYEEKFWRLIGKAVKPSKSFQNTAIADINCFCIEFYQLINGSVAKNVAIFVAFCTTKSAKSI